MDKKKLTPEQQFFNDKTLEFAEELYNQSEERLLEAYKGQIKNRDDLLSKIAKILLSYNIADNILKINAAEKKMLYSELSDLIITNIKSELEFETSLTKDILTSVGKEKFNTNNYIYSLGTDFNLTQLDNEALKKIINTKVDNKLWSDRLWENKNVLSKDIKVEVKKFLTGETNVNNIENVIKKKYNENAYETKRLIQDNICRVQEGANNEWQHEHGIKKVMYLATLDGKVCSRCAQYDTKVFELDKKPVEIPQHPFCRCVYISLVNENWRPKMRLDNETKENINWQSYEEWKRNYIENNPERLLIHKMIKNKSSDKRIYEKYKDILGKEMPKTLEDFQKMKYNNTNRWEEVKTFVDAKSNGRISNDATLKQWDGIVKKVNDRIIGITTPNGIKITELSHHGIERFIGDGEKRKGVLVEDVRNALLNPLDIKEIKVDNFGRKSQKFIGEKSTISINPETGNIIQTNPTSSKLAERLKRRSENDKVK